MISNTFLDPIRAEFAKQFKKNASGVFYQKGKDGVPIRVSEGERRDFVEVFNRRLNFLSWSIFPAGTLFSFALLELFGGAYSSAFVTALMLGLAAIGAVFAVIYYWVWNTPFRELQHSSRADFS